MPKNAATTARKRGRPAHVPTAATRRQVSIAAGGGMRHEDIALALGITRDTLRKWYLNELTVVASTRRLEVLNAMYAAAKKGSSSAAKAFLAAMPEFEVPPEGLGSGLTKPAAPAAPEAKEPVQKAGVPLGKKEQAQVDAVTAAAGTEWENLLKSPTPLQ